MPKKQQCLVVKILSLRVHARLNRFRKSFIAQKTSASLLFSCENDYIVEILKYFLDYCKRSLTRWEKNFYITQYAICNL